jgi:hypothetical protein
MIPTLTEFLMEEIGVAQTVHALKDELAEALCLAEHDEIQFPMGSVELEFHVGIKKSGEGKAGVKFWVVELGAGGTYAAESIQKVTVKLEPPVGLDGLPIKVGRPAATKP